MTSLLLSRRDLDSLLFEWLAVESFTRHPRYSAHSRDTFVAAMDLSERIASERFAPHNTNADQNEPRFVNGRIEMSADISAALGVFRDAGLFG